MNKIFRYELRRLLWNKLFFGILLVSLGYGWLTLTGSVVRGVAHTAPFSPWSFGYYLSQALPLICLGDLVVPHDRKDDGRHFLGDMANDVHIAQPLRRFLFVIGLEHRIELHRNGTGHPNSPA